MKIKKKNIFAENRCKLQLDTEREGEFNAGGTIEISEEEYKIISQYKFFDIVKENEDEKGLSQKTTSGASTKE